MNLIKTSSLSLIATIFKLLFGLVINKLVAVYGGAPALALIGQFQNIQTSFVSGVTAGFSQGVTKYLAEFKGNVGNSRSIFVTAVKLVCILSVPISLILFIFAGDLSELFFNTRQFDVWLQGVSVSLLPASLGLIFLSALNGLGEVRYLTVTGVLSSCFSIGMAILLIPAWGTSGAIVVLLISPFFVTLVSIWYLQRTTFFSWACMRVNIVPNDAFRLAKFSLMALTTAISVPVSQICIRNYLGESISIEGAGLWTGLWRVSEAYLLVITMTLSVYYLPKLSSLMEKEELLDEMKRGYIFIMPLVVVSSVTLFLVRDWIVALLFTEDFIAMSDLFLWQLVGDVMKIGCFLMGFILLAKGLVTIYIIKEIVISVLFVLFTYAFVNQLGLVGVTIAYFATYSVNFIWLVLIMRYYFRNFEKKDKVST